MQLKDYLHYYIGCKFLFDSKVWELFRIEITGKEVLVTGKRKEQFWKHNSMWVSECKPILRRLEDMTEEEAITVHREATKTPFLPAYKDEYDVTYIKDKGEVCSIDVVDLRMPTMYTNIDIKGDILVYVHEQNQEPKICERVANQHYITHYLLRQHFDLFNLIDNGLAVDAKTISNI